MGTIVVIASNVARDDFMHNRITFTVDEYGGPVREFTLDEAQAADPDAVHAAIVECLAK